MLFPVALPATAVVHGQAKLSVTCNQPIDYQVVKAWTEQKPGEVPRLVLRLPDGTTRYLIFGCEFRPLGDER